MKQKIQIIGTLFIIFLFLELIFQLGEKVIYQDSNKGFSSFYFSSTVSKINNDDDIKDALEIIVANNEYEMKKFQLNYLIDEFEIETVEVDILGGKKQIVKVPQKVFNYLSIQPGGEFEVVILINWSDENASLTKNITFTNE